MVTINDAYQNLSNLSLRQEYDDKLRQENKTASSTTQSSTQSARPNQYSYYASYTRTREESESDFDEWLKEYLKRERRKYSYDDKDEFNKFNIDLLNKLKDKITENTEDFISRYYGQTNYSCYDEKEKPDKRR